MNSCKFSFGQEVWIAEASAWGTVRVQCPVCFGKRSVVLVLGNGESVPVECDACGNGCEGPSGTVVRYQPTSCVTSEEVTGIRLSGDDWFVRAGDREHRLSDGAVFATRPEAEARAKVLYAEAVERNQRMWEENINSKRKKHAWTVGYHRSEIKELKRRLAWHEGRLVPHRNAVTTEAT